MGDKIRRRLSTLRLEELRVRAASLGLVLDGLTHIPPPESDLMRSRWYPKFPETLRIVDELVFADVAGLLKALCIEWEVLSDDGSFVLYLSDDLVGALVAPASFLAEVSNMEKLLRLDGDSVVVTAGDASGWVLDLLVDGMSEEFTLARIEAQRI